MPILFISNSNFSPGLSGGDRIFLELIRRWSKYQPVGLMGAAETKDLCHFYHLDEITFYLTSRKNEHIIPTIVNVLSLQFIRTIKSLYYVLSHLNQIRQYDIIYSVSDFYADFFPALLIKLIYPKTKWIAGYFLFAPKPNDPNSPYIKTGQSLKGYFYYFSQSITYFLTKLYADYVFVTSEPDVGLFLSKRLPKQKIIVIRGGVDISNSSKYLKIHSLAPLTQRKYSACFMGRLHPQKGVLELIDIWRNVVDQLPKATLALIGNGQLESQVVNKIKKLKLIQNIELFGFLDGEKKDAIFRNSCIVLHPAIYDSGGMASAEAMAWGLPAVSFDLEALKTYYPKGMVKIPCYNLSLFSKTIIKLLKNKTYYSKMSKASLNLITEFWDWDRQAKNIYQSLNL